MRLGRPTFKILRFPSLMILSEHLLLKIYFLFSYSTPLLYLRIKFLFPTQLHCGLLRAGALHVCSPQHCWVARRFDTGRLVTILVKKRMCKLVLIG